MKNWVLPCNELRWGGCSSHDLGDLWWIFFCFLNDLIIPWDWFIMGFIIMGHGYYHHGHHWTDVEHVFFFSQFFLLIEEAKWWVKVWLQVFFWGDGIRKICKFWIELRGKVTKVWGFRWYSWQPFGNDQSLPSKVWRCFGTMYPTFSLQEYKACKAWLFIFLAFKVDSFHKSKSLRFICLFFFGQNVLIGLIGFIVLWYFSTTSFQWIFQGPPMGPPYGKLPILFP